MNSWFDIGWDMAVAIQMVMLHSRKLTWTLKMMVSGQIIRFHQPGFSCNKDIFLPKSYLLGALVVWRHYNLAWWFGRYISFSTLKSFVISFGSRFLAYSPTENSTFRWKSVTWHHIKICWWISRTSTVILLITVNYLNHHTYNPPETNSWNRNIF